MSALTPASELKVAAVTSLLYSSPPNCQRSVSNWKSPVNVKGSVQEPWIDLAFIACSAWM